MSRERDARLHARTRTFARRLAQAEALVEEALATGAAWYVSLSGGKDSTVVLDLVRRQYPDVPAVWSDDGWWLPETTEYMERLRAAGVALEQIRTTDQHAEWFRVEGEWSGIPAYARSRGWSGVFLGLRAEENARRRMHLAAHGLLSHGRDGWQSNPIGRWSTMDVWAYLYRRDVDYNWAYDVLERIGVPLERQRIGPFASERALGYGALTVLKRGWPDLFERFAATHPEARSYA